MMEQICFEGYRFKFKFNASHYINSTRPDTVHSHTFHIVFYLENDNNNFIVYNEIEKQINTMLERYKGKCLNFVYPFDKIVPTLENICKEIYQNVEEYCNKMGIILKKICISDNSLTWYSIGEHILIDSLNEIISEEMLTNHINELKEKYSFIEKDIQDKENIFDEFIRVKKTSNTGSSIDDYLNNYLNKENVKSKGIILKQLFPAPSYERNLIEFPIMEKEN